MPPPVLGEIVLARAIVNAIAKPLPFIEKGGFNECRAAYSLASIRSEAGRRSR